MKLHNISYTKRTVFLYIYSNYTAMYKFGKAVVGALHGLRSSGASNGKPRGMDRIRLVCIKELWLLLVVMCIYI